MSSNLSPGITDNMLPGNRPEDEWWDSVHEELDENVSDALNQKTLIGDLLQTKSEEYSPYDDDPSFVAQKLNEYYWGLIDEEE